MAKYALNSMFIIEISINTTKNPNVSLLEIYLQHIIFEEFDKFIEKKKKKLY